MPSLKSNKNLHRLPSNLNPLGRRCYPISIPDDPEWIGMFLGAMYELGYQSRYDRDEAHSARLVAQVWKGIYQENLATILANGQCNPELSPDDGCTAFPAHSHFVSYAPNDPYQTPEYVPQGYLLPPFYTDPAIPLPGVLPGDAMVNFAAIPIFANLGDLITSGLPRIRINFSGEGEVELELVRVPQGGIAYVTQDGDPSTGEFVDLNELSIGEVLSLEEILDITLEGAIVTTEIIERTFDTAGEHYIDITFLPNVGTDIILGFGGGLRRISLCGLATPGEVIVPQFQINGCNLEWRPNTVSAWVSLGNVCGEDGENGTNGADGRTPELRGVAVDADTNRIEWKYTDEPIEAWQSLIEVDDGTQGIPGVDGEDGRDPEIRMIAIEPTVQAVEWKYTSDPDIQASWRTAGYVEDGEDGLPGECECDPQAEPPDVIVPGIDPCQLAYGLVNFLAQDVIAAIDYAEALEDDPLYNYSDVRFGVTYSINAGYLGLGYIPALYNWGNDIFLNSWSQTIADDIRTIVSNPVFQQALMDYAFGHIPTDVSITEGDITAIDTSWAALEPTYGISLTAMRLWLNLVPLKRINYYFAQMLDKPDVYNCTPPATVYCRTFDFTVDDGGWECDLDNATGGCWGTYSNGVGWKPTDQFIGNGQYARLMLVKIPFVGNITQATVEFAYDRGTFTTGTAAFQIRDDDQNTVIIQTNQSAMPDGNYVKQWNGDREVTDHISVYIRCSNRTGQAYDGDVTLTRVTISGNGSNPFGADNC